MTPLLISTFVVMASQSFHPWTDTDYCGGTHASIEQQAADICQPFAAKLEGDYVDQFKGMTCNTTATYSCATTTPPVELPQTEPK